MAPNLLPVIEVAKPKAVLLDMDGTCGPLSYFPSVMAPYLPTHVRQCVAEGLRDKSKVMMDIIKRLRIEYQRKIPADLHPDHRTEIPEYTGGAENCNAILTAVFANFMSQVEEQKKSATITALCWLVWTDGFRKGELHGDVFPDVPEALQNWHSAGIKICTVSAMISLGQQLLFTCSNYGNLDCLMDGYLCTKDFKSHKYKRECYEAVCSRLDVAPKDLLFFTDVGKEAVAAKEAGCRAILVTRKGNAPLKPIFTANYNVISSFSQVHFVDV
jgi:2,3-diketo-5-methylthio-1-phosphopentane phosphatase